MKRNRLLIGYLLLLTCAWHNSQSQITAIPVKEIAPGSGWSEPRFVVVLNNIMYFAANNGTQGRELWRSDGTDAGTWMVKDIRPGSQGSNPNELTVSNGFVFFAADDGTNGWEFWRSDGTEAGTVLVKDIYAGYNNSNCGWFTDVNGTLYFSAATNANGQELWKSDGTAAGTVLVKDIIPGSFSSNPSWFAYANGVLLFSAYNSFNGYALWKSDGTEDGTVQIKDVSFGLNPIYLTGMNGHVYFAGNDGGANGTVFWKSDGTEAGTEIIMDITPGGSGGPKFITNVNNTLYFAAHNGSTGDELWKSDGTTAGTVLVKDINPGSLGSTPQEFKYINGACYFQANTQTQGTELWKTDGTAAGTVLVLDFDPGVSASIPDNITGMGGDIYFVAANDESGRELFKLVGSTLPVTWVSFSSTWLSDNTVKLDWQVTNETGNSHYEIQHSINGNNYTTLGTVPATIMAAGTHSYSYKHLTPTRTVINYYRLKQVDKDGRFEYSKIVTVTTKGEGASLTLSPNPVTGAFITLSSKLLQEQPHVLTITSESGMLIQRVQVPKQPSAQYQLLLPHLSNGVYLLHLQGGDRTETRKVLIQR